MTKLTPRANEFENRSLVAAIRIGIAVFVLVDLILFLQLRQEDSPISAREIQSEKFKSGDLKDVLDKDFGAVGAVDLDKSHSTQPKANSTQPKAKGKRSTTPPAPQAFTAPQDHSSSEGSTVEAPSGGSTTGSGGSSSDDSAGGTVPGGSTGGTPSDDDSSGVTPPGGGGGGGGDEVPPGDGSGGDSGSDSGGSGGGGGGGGAGP